MTTDGSARARVGDAGVGEISSGASSRNPGGMLLRVAWLAVASGLAMEGLLLLLAAGLGERMPGRG